MNLKKELEKMNHADLLWICKYMKVSCNSKYTNKKIIGILLEPISNKKYRAGGQVYDPNEISSEQQLTPQEIEEARAQAKKEVKDRLLERFNKLSLTTQTNKLTEEEEKNFKARLKKLEEEPTQEEPTQSNCTIC